MSNESNRPGTKEKWGEKGKGKLAFSGSYLKKSMLISVEWGENGLSQQLSSSRSAKQK